MSAHDELVAANAAIRELLESGAGAQLRAIPGVQHVSVGLKERGGAATDTLCIRVYVRKKLPKEEVAPKDRIPHEIGGVPTDVLVVEQPEFSNSERVRPLKGGTEISNRIIVLSADGVRVGLSVGTFGCTVTRIRDGAVMLLTNWHVVTANGGDVDSPIYQPAPDPVPSVSAADLPLHPTDDVDRIAMVAYHTVNSKVDAAIARLDISSCCRCCGLDYRDEIAGLSVSGTPSSDRIRGQRVAVAGAPVYKVGSRTGRTAGRVVDADYPDFTITRDGTPYTFSGQIAIESADGTTIFSASGDSGAVIVDADGYILGLYFASTNQPPPARRGFANHIADVCSELGIRINMDESASTTAGALINPRVVRLSDDDIERFATIRARLLDDDAGTWLWMLAEEHREEVVRLVTEHRPVTVAWHRASGPALFATALNTLRAGRDTLPVPLDGSTLEAALTRIGEALRKHGSAALREDLELYAPLLLAAVRNSVTVADLLDNLRSAIPANDLAIAGEDGMLV